MNYEKEPNIVFTLFAREKYSPKRSANNSDFVSKYFVDLDICFLDYSQELYVFIDLIYIAYDYNFNLIELILKIRQIYLF